MVALENTQKNTRQPKRHLSKLGAFSSDLCDISKEVLMINGQTGNIAYSFLG